MGETFEHTFDVKSFNLTCMYKGRNYQLPSIKIWNKSAEK